MGRVMALDYGRRRIGVAISDPGRTIASPLAVIPNADPPARPPEALLELVRRVGPAEIVLGIPLRMNGTEGEMAREARQFGQALSAASGVPVVEWDERLSTVRAERELDAAAPRPRAARRRRARRRSSRRRRRRPERGSSDRVAAALLLQAYLGGAGPR